VLGICALSFNSPLSSSLSRSSLPSSPAAAAAAPSPPTTLTTASPPHTTEPLHASTFPDAALTATVTQDPATGDLSLRLASDPPVPGRALHWGLDGWAAPPAAAWPAGTTAVDAKAVNSPFEADGSGLTLTFKAGALPSAVVFVLREPGGGWTSPSGGRDGRVPLRPPSMGDVLARMVASEADPGAASLFTRFCAANDLLDDAGACGPEGVAALLTWLRLSSTRALPWYGGHCYQTKDAAHVQKNLVERVASLAAAGLPADVDPAAGEVRALARRALATLPRGGGGGDDIRMGILHIMRDHGACRGERRVRGGARAVGVPRLSSSLSVRPSKPSHSQFSPPPPFLFFIFYFLFFYFLGIREGHRPGLDEPFLEQWHQKLHTSTTPEDVTICEAYLDVQRSDGSDPGGVFFGSLWDRAGISKTDLAAMARPITVPPMHLPHMAQAFEGYLWILKATHGGADLETAAAMARGPLGGDLAWAVGDLVSNRGAWWAPGKAVELREAIHHLVRPEGGGTPNRDVALLDAALEDFVRLGVERADLASLSTPDLVALACLVLRSADVGRDSVDISRVRALWDRLAGVEAGADGEGAPSKAWAAAALAACQRASLALAASADRLTSLTQPVADAFHAALVPGGGDDAAPCTGLKAAAIAGFGEEVARGAPVAVLAAVLRALEPRLRASAGVGPWAVAAPGPAGGVSGTLTCVDTLAAVQGKVFDEAKPVVLVAAGLDGSEDIPLGVSAVLTSSETDVLSHVAIRARAQGVLLASCVDPDAFAAVQALGGKGVKVSVSAGGDVLVAAGGATAPAAPSTPSTSNPSAPPRLTLAAPMPSKSWALAEGEFKAGTVGGKALNLAALRTSAAGSAARLPSSVALPFGTCERVLADPLNAATAKTVAALEAELKAWAGAGVPPQLKALRAALATGLVAPPGLVAEVGGKAASAGLASAGAWGAPAEWQPVWAAVTGVWASKWGARAWLSRRATGVPDAALSMAVLLQEVLPAAYAFVLHTADPLTGDAGCVYGEVVLGMGEALVGNAPGRAAAFRAPKDPGAPIELLAWPAKRDAWWSAGGLIARSDSNGEDLADFAGAGLYDSVPVGGLVKDTTDCAADDTLWWGGGEPGGLGGGGGREALLAKLRDVGVAIEGACGGIPQDVEGVVMAGGEVAVVQARAQV